MYRTTAAIVVSALVGFALAASPAAAATDLFPQRVIRPGWSSATFVQADFDGDGHADLAGSISQSGTTSVSVLLGNGDGTFGAPALFPATGGLRSLADLNGDGRADLVTVDRGPHLEPGAVCSLLGNGDGTFQAPACSAPVAENPEFPVAGDFNSDGRLDVVVTTDGTTDDLVFLPGNGDGTFGVQSRIATDFPDSLLAADLNEDGDLDLAVVHSFSNQVSLLLGNGDGTFAPGPALLAVGDFPEMVASADLNGDAHADLVTANSGSDDLSLLLGNGDGTFASEIRERARPIGNFVTVADFNADGLADLAATGANEVAVFLGRSDGSFGAIFGFFGAIFGLPSQEFPSGLAVADFDEDGDQDLAVGGGGDLSIFPGEGDGSFPFSPRECGTAGQTVTTADFDLDGIPDIAAGPNVCMGSGDFTFRIRDIVPFPTFNAAGDFNSDGRPDLAGSQGGSADQVVVSFGNGDGTFSTPVVLPVGDEPYRLEAADLDSDGDDDLVVPNRQSSMVSVLLSNGDGTFAPQVTYPVGLGPLAVAVGDFDENGTRDLAVANRAQFTQYSLSILPGNGDGTFQPEVRYNTVVSRPGDIATADFDGDGHLDLVVGSEGDAEVEIFTGHGDGTFTGGALFGTGVVSISVETADFNLDGAEDIATASFTDKMSALLGTGTGSFLPRQVFVSGSSSFTIAVADFNLDGRPDLVTANSGAPYVTVHPNGVDFLSCLDGDHDGFGAPGRPSCQFGPETDCDDQNSLASPLVQEFTDGLDNDCDGFVDEIVVLATCGTQPDVLNLQSQGTTFSINTTLLNFTNDEAVIDPAPLLPVYISRIVGEEFEIVLPTPRAAPGCDDLTEDGIWETLEDRTVTGSNSATLRFSTPSDGQCETRDGNLQDITALLLDVPNEKGVEICYVGSYPGAPDPFECCAFVRIGNRGNR